MPPRAPKPAPKKAAPKLAKAKTMVATAADAASWQAKTAKTAAKKAKATKAVVKDSKVVAKKLSSGAKPKKSPAAASSSASSDDSHSYRELVAKAVVELSNSRKSASLQSIKKHVQDNHPTAASAVGFAKHITSALAKLVSEGLVARDASSFRSIGGKAVATTKAEPKSSSSKSGAGVKRAVDGKKAAATTSTAANTKAPMIRGYGPNSYYYGWGANHAVLNVPSSFMVQAVSKTNVPLTTGGDDVVCWMHPLSGPPSTGFGGNDNSDGTYTCPYPGPGSTGYWTVHTTLNSKEIYDSPWTMFVAPTAAANKDAMKAEGVTAATASTFRATSSASGDKKSGDKKAAASPAKKAKVAAPKKAKATTAAPKKAKAAAPKKAKTAAPKKAKAAAPKKKSVKA